MPFVAFAGKHVGDVGKSLHVKHFSVMIGGSHSNGVTEEPVIRVARLPRHVYLGERKKAVPLQKKPNHLFRQKSNANVKGIIVPHMLVIS